MQQTIKDINQSLVDDFLVCFDKIGAANFFWSFPSKAYQDQVTLKNNYNVHLQAIQEAVESIDKEIIEATEHRQAEGRATKLRRLHELREEEKQADMRLEELKFNDPEEIKKILKQAEVNKAAADRWTDNIWTMKSYLMKKKGMPSKEVSMHIVTDSTLISFYINTSLHHSTVHAKIGGQIAENWWKLWLPLHVITVDGCCVSALSSCTYHFTCK